MFPDNFITIYQRLLNVHLFLAANILPIAYSKFENNIFLKQIIIRTFLKV